MFADVVPDAQHRDTEASCHGGIIQPILASASISATFGLVQVLQARLNLSLAGRMKAALAQPIKLSPVQR
jgi:hypothetical protein